MSYLKQVPQLKKAADVGSAARGFGSAAKQGSARQRPFAVFDIDGTLIRWQLYHAISDALAHAGLIDAKAFANVRAARMTWKKRAGQNSFNDYENALIKAYDDAIINITQKQFLAAAVKAFEEYKDQTYTYTRDMLRSLKQKGYLLFAISASQADIVEMLAGYYGFDGWGGSVYEVKNERFTGQKQVLKSRAKPDRLLSLAIKHKAVFDGSIGVGDSDSDIPMLELVEQPLVFNPNKKLFEHARAKGWPVVVERKNVVYKLELKNGRYFLA